MEPENFPLPIGVPAEFQGYDEERLDLPGLIQPHGILLALQPQTLILTHVSQNIAAVIAQPAASLIGQKLNALFTPRDVKQIKHHLQDDRLSYTEPLILKLGPDHLFRGVINQRLNSTVLLELEAIASTTEPKTIIDYRLDASILNLRQGVNLLDLCERAVAEIKHITDFDRVLVYRFGFEGAGEVIAEEVTPGHDRYLGLHYPHFDIPPQAREFYRKNWLRMIPNIDYEPVPLIPPCGKDTPHPLDLTHASLRSVSPCHIQYLRNMGVQATMSISLINNNKLWGLIACHHYSPKHLNPSLRQVCEFLGQYLSVEIQGREEQELQQYRVKITELQQRLKSTILKKPVFLGDLLRNNTNQLLKLFDSQGVAICFADHVSLMGETPTRDQVRELVHEFLIQQHQEVFQTNNLMGHYPPAEAYKQDGSGILAVSIFLMTTSYHVIWFRAEQSHVVNWAGNPATNLTIHEDKLELCPRNSFVLWQEQVQNKSLPWQSLEIESAAEFRNFVLLAALEYSNFSKEVLEQAIHKANSANQAKGEFLAKMSHELRTPLNAILGYGQILNKEKSLSGRQKEYIEIINRSGEQLLSLINDVLEVSRIEAGQITLNEENFDLKLLLQSIREIFQIKALAKGLDLIVEEDPHLPQYVYGDQSKLRQIIFNLVSNAIKFTHTGYVAIRIFPRSCPLPPSGRLELIIEVEDTGMGVSEEDQYTIFEPFKQARNHDQTVQGTGLGLAISHQFARLMHGDITLKSTLGQGSTFTYHVELKPVNNLINFSEPPSTQVIGLEPHQPIFKLLVVEDVPENQKLMLDILQTVGFDVRSANNGQEAIAVWEEWQPDLIWMDMKMPIMNGYEAVKIIRAQEELNAQDKVVIIALTASAFNEEKEAILTSGCNDFVRKPCKEEIIFNKISQYLNVQYVYESQAKPGEDELNHPHRLSSDEVQELKTLVELMPPLWRERMHNYALTARENNIVELAQQIPDHHQDLKQYIFAMVETLAFDKIVELVSGGQSHG